ncbi:hypothetical protein DESUT3_08310 [Desulfuromonas versatilis]|uniref:ATP-grasp domain-containing protein n=1 Tax=Desulfuromonas versatilis TaxID=2802975 RepID=A0ABM8HS39_9BACT|nr:hypothetical protein [Desulfuromonas versatilis]BCR03762.1 hypothetical protein DESUT3_08310 [Desulfuromonas versatilis]
MRLVSFNPYRSLGLPGVRYIKPELALRHKDEVKAADWALFPESWQVNFLAYGLKVPIFPNLSTFHLGYDKVEMTRAFWAVAPEHFPHTLILPSNENAIGQVLDELSFPMVGKEIRNSMGRGTFLLQNRRELIDYAARNPVLYLQEYLPIDRDLRVVYVGDRVVSAYWRIAGEGQFLTNVAQGGRLCFEAIPPEALQLVERIARALEINHAGFDLALVEGHFYFLEFNPMFGNEGLARSGVPLAEIIWEYLLTHTSRPPVAPGRPPLARAI